MLTEQNAIPESVSLGTDSMPFGFVISEDGQTLLAVTGHESGVIELMTTPVTFIQQNNMIVQPIIKMNSGTSPVNSPMLQISLDQLNTSGIDQPPLISTNLNETSNIAAFDNRDNRAKHVNIEEINQTQIPENSELKTSDEVFGKLSSCTGTTEIKESIKRSPGRPRKDANSSTGNVANKLRCEICGQEFKRLMLYRKHIEHHAEEKPHRCPKCSASFNVPTNFTLHMATHNTGDPKCPECGRKFARMASLKSHMLLHEKEESLFCTECQDAFSTKAQLDAHLKFHNEKWSTEDVRKCKLCNKQFTQPALYRLHIREHYRSKIVKQSNRATCQKTMYKCKICLKSFQKPSQLMRHIRVHTGEKPFKCTVCSRAFTQKGSLQIHMWQHVGIRPYGCQFCNAKFSQKGNLNAHILRVHNAPEGEPIYGCTHCTCVFKKLGSLNGHMKKMHSNTTDIDNATSNDNNFSKGCKNEEEITQETPQKCDSSTEAKIIQATVANVMKQLTSLDSSVKTQADSTNSGLVTNCKEDILQQALKNSGLPSKVKHPEVSSVMDKKGDAQTSFVTLLDRTPDGSLRRYLTIKQRSIGSIRWYACSFCQKEFKKPSDLIRHLRVHTQEKPFKCSYCYRSFALKSTMIAHERIHTGSKKYTCATCDKTFACHSSLIAHTRSHTKPHKCNLCVKSFSTSSILKSHIRSHAKGKNKISPEAEILVPQIVLKEPLVISDAGNKISVAHVQSKQKQVYDTADDARSHKCWVCPAAFRKISHLKQHYRRHTGERPYKCPKCERRFTSNSVLKSHLHTHEESRPYSCLVCNAKFSTQSSMKRHLVTHSNKRPFMCPYCHKTFKTSVNCRKHMKIHKTELALQQLEQQKMQEEPELLPIEEKTVTDQGLPENLTVPEDMVVFQPEITPDFSQTFNNEFQTISMDKEKSFIDDDETNQSIDNQSLPTVDTVNLGTSQTLHADETGTITLPNYSGDQTLTPESIREIEETLNQQLFNIGMSDTSAVRLESREQEQHQEQQEQQPVLNIIYEKGLDSVNNASINSNIFSSHFDTFDMSQIALQTDTEIDIGISPANSTSMASILPRSAQEEQRLVPIMSCNNIDEASNKTAKRLMLVSSVQASPEFSKRVQVCSKYPKVIAKADTTDNTDNNLIKRKNIDSSPLNDRTIDQEDMIFVCRLCNQQFSNERLLEAHGETHAILNPMKSLTDKKEMVVLGTDSELSLQCHMCSKKGFTTKTLNCHLNTHRGKKEFQCSECPLKFCTNGGLSRHLKMHANKQQQSNCSICLVPLDETQLESHTKLHEKQEWNFPRGAEADSSQKESLILELPNISTRTRSDNSTDRLVSKKVLLDTVAEQETLNQSNNNPELTKEKKEHTNKCKYCPKTFRKPSDLIRHIRTHTGERPYKCEFCNKSFAVKCTLDCHMKVHTGKKTFCCHVCNSLFATKGSLKVHMRLHTGSKPFKCPMCDLRFRTSGHRKVHQLTHTRENKGTSRKPKQMKVAAIAGVVAEVEKSVENSLNLPVVSEELQTTEQPNFDTVAIETNGISDQIIFNADGTVLNNNSMLSINESNQLVANLHFLLANGLVTIHAEESLLNEAGSSDIHEIHDNNVAERFVTPLNHENREIGEQEEQQITFNDNSRNNLIIAPQFSALTCQNQTSQQNTMEINNYVSLESIEATTATSIQSAENLEEKNIEIQHQQRQTTNSVEKLNISKKECDICGKTFMKPCQVERHKRIHTGERPFKCELCSKSFAQKATLQMHQKHHTGDRPHPCPHCDYSFTQKGNLQTHLKRAHQLDTLEVKKLRRGQQQQQQQQQQILNANAMQNNLDDARTFNFDDISFIEFLK